MTQTTKARSTVESRARSMGRKLYGRTVTVQRTTGANGLSGWFRAYRYDRRLAGLNSVGEPFHVS